MDAKQILTCATLLAGLTLFNAPLEAAVESSIVGYTTVTTNAGFNMMGVSFANLDKEAIPLNQMLSGDFKDGDEIQLYDKEIGYTVYSYWKNDGGWLDGSFNPASIPVALGTAFWLKTPGRSVVVTFTGAVATGNYTYEGKAGFQMIAAGVPVAIDLNGVTWSGLSDEDEIQVRNGDGYTTYSYWKNEGGWLDGDFELVQTPIIPVGASMWLKAKQDGVTLTIPGHSN